MNFKSGSRVGVALLLALLAGCDSLSDVGKQDEAAPAAIATSIGEAFANDADGNMTMTIRSGADVVLSGKESQKGANDAGIPIIYFDWQQSPSDTVKVKLIRRTSNTVSFTAPQVASDTTLHFTLAVSDAKGAADSAEATVTVRSVRDADHFLQYLSSAPPGNFSIVLATQADIAGVASAAATAQLPATIRLTKLLTFRDRDSSRTSSAPTFTRVPIGTAVIQTSGWSTRVGSSSSCTAPENPVVQLPIPKLDLDEFLPTPADISDPTLDTAKAQLVALKGKYPDATTLADVLEPADLSGDGVKLELQIDVMTGPGSVAKPCLSNANESPITLAAADVVLASPSSTVIVPVESASAQVGTAAIAGLWPLNAANRDSRESAKAYYAAIDPDLEKATLNGWLTKNGFDPAATGYGADAHAVYTNNYDLGFGRDMYLKYGACDAGAAGLPLQSRLGKCDVAAVVFNYPNVEGAAKKLNAFAAVAMEYSRVRNAGNRFVKFYTFIPDSRDGALKRALSLNFDRRGEQYVPQACVSCHGGTPGAYTPSAVPGQLGTYANGGDVKAAFLPWDLDSFLYSDGPNADPGFSRKQRDAGLRAQYTRAAQEAQFKLLNSGAYLTMANGLDQTSSDDHHFDLGRELVEKWYGGLAAGNLKNDSYDDTGVTAGWSKTGNSNPADSEDIYHKVFARNCRTCHVLQVPKSADPRTATVRLNNLDVPACSTPTAVNTFVGANSQVPMGCYWEFAHAPNLVDRLSRAHMPFARRTMDRIWLGPDGTVATSVGAQLATHLGKTVAEVVPGTPSAATTLTQQAPAGTCTDAVFAKQSATAYTARRNYWLTADGSTSNFPTLYSYALTPPAGSVGALVGAKGQQARFKPDVPGAYALSLDVGGTSPATATVTVKNCAPTAPAVANYSTTRNALLTVSTAVNGLLANAADLDGDALAIVRDTTDAACSTLYASSLVVNADGTFSYKHDGTLAFTAGEQDHFKVRISDQYGGTAAICVTVTINAAPDGTPPSPAPSLTATPVIGGGGTAPSVSLSWTASQDRDDNGNPRTLLGYEVSRCLVTLFGCSYVQIASPAGLSFSDTTAPTGASVRYRVAALDQSTNRTFSAEAPVTTYRSFAQDVFPLLGTSSHCESCHVIAGAAAAYWQYSSSSATTTWSSLNQWTTKTSAGAATSTPSQAALYTNPCTGTNAHSTTAQVLGGTQCAVVLQWIAEGHASN